MGEEAAVRVARRDASMRAHLLEVQRADAACGLVDLLQPGTEAEEDHTSALEPPRLELDRAAGDGAVSVAQGPARLLAEVERQDRVAGRVANTQRDHWRRDSACLTAHGAQS